MNEVWVGAIAALAGTGLGAWLTTLADRRLWKRQASIEAAHMLAETYALVWGDRPLTPLTIHLEQLRARLVVLGVPDGLVVECEESANAVWRESHNDFAIGSVGPDGEAWISMEGWERLRAAQDAIRSEIGVAPKRRRRLFGAR